MTGSSLTWSSSISNGDCIQSCQTSSFSSGFPAIAKCASRPRHPSEGHENAGLPRATLIRIECPFSSLPHKIHIRESFKLSHLRLGSWNWRSRSFEPGVRGVLISELIEERDFFGGFMEGQARGDRSRGDRAQGRRIVRVKDAIFYVAVRALRLPRGRLMQTKRGVRFERTPRWRSAF